MTETRLRAALLAAQRLRACAHTRLTRRVLVTWHMLAAARLARQARAACSRLLIRHARSRLLQAAFCAWRAEHTAARARVPCAGMLQHRAGVNALHTMVLGWPNLTATMLRQHSSILLARHRARTHLLRAALHAWSPHNTMSKGAVLTAPRRPPGLLGIWLRLACWWLGGSWGIQKHPHICCGSPLRCWPMAGS